MFFCIFYGYVYIKDFRGEVLTDEELASCKFLIYSFGGGSFILLVFHNLLEAIMLKNVNDGAIAFSGIFWLVVLICTFYQIRKLAHLKKGRGKRI